MLISKRKLKSLLEQVQQETIEQEAIKYMDKEDFTRKYQALKDVYKMKHDRLYKDMKAKSQRDAEEYIRLNQRPMQIAYDEIHEELCEQRKENIKLMKRLY